MEDLRKKNPKQAAVEDERMRLDQLKKEEDKLMKRTQLLIADKYN